MALVIVAVAVTYLVTRGSSYRYYFTFADAGQLVTGDLVRIGGTDAGTVETITLTDNGQAKVGVDLSDSFGPLHRGTTATIRSPGVTSIASRYIDVSPAPPFDPKLPDGYTFPSTATHGIVDIDEVFDALDANSREGLRRMIRGFSAWYDGESAAANETSNYLPPALTAYTKLFNQIDADAPALNQFISQTNAVLGTIDTRAPRVTDLITQGATTADALSSDNASLTQALSDLPAAFTSGTRAFTQLRTQALPGLTNLFNATGPVVTPLSQFLPKLNPVLSASEPVLSLLSQMFDKPGAHDDLYDALVQLPQLSREVKADFPEAIDALHSSTPIFEFARPYIPDLVAWITNWDGVFSPYDANGHYARAVPAFGAFDFADSAGGGTLTQTPPSDRGQSGYVQTGLLERCPGSAAIGASPFVDSGALSNAHCNASETLP